jgi:hypothetical protein
VNDDSQLMDHLDSFSLTNSYNALIDTHSVETLELKIEEDLAKD